MTSTSGRPDSALISAAHDDVEGRLFQALALLRVVLVINMVGLNAVRADNFDRPILGAAVVVALIAWTGIATWLYASAERRTQWLLIADLAVAVSAMLLTWWVKGDDLRATIPGFWVMAPLLAWAVHWGWRGGTVAALMIVAADLAIRGEFTQVNYGNVFLVLIGGPIVGYISDSLKQMAAQRDVAQREAAIAAERARLARAVHDGVLQVLALVQRRGAEAGGEFTQLGKLAGEQESALRALIRQQDSLRDHGPESTLDVCNALERLESSPQPKVSVATPGHPVELPAATVREVVAVAQECVSNIATHVGADAEAWILVEAVGGELIVSVRDAGQGIPDGRLVAAAAEGRLGVAGSIRGRIADLGGIASLTTGDWGTEWEFTIPLSPAGESEDRGTGTRRGNV